MQIKTILSCILSSREIFGRTKYTISNRPVFLNVFFKCVFLSKSMVLCKKDVSSKTMLIKKEVSLKRLFLRWHDVSSKRMFNNMFLWKRMFLQKGCFLEQLMFLGKGCLFQQMMFLGEGCLFEKVVYKRCFFEKNVFSKINKIIHNLWNFYIFKHKRPFFIALFMISS